MLMLLHDAWEWLTSRVSSERGVTAVEYGIMVSLIAVVIIGAVTIIGNNLNDVFTEVGNAITP
jgi:pilus assembly protein Flp/PilA